MSKIRTREVCFRELKPPFRWITVCENVPLIDWKLFPQNPKFKTTNDVGIFVQNLQVPELQYIYPNYDGFKFVMQFTNSSAVDWIICSSSKLDGNVLHISPGENEDLTYTLYNFDLLELGKTQLVVKCQAFGIKNGVEIELNENIEGVIELLKTDNSDSAISTNKDVFNIQFNLANNTLSGDKEIIIYNEKDLSWARPFNLLVKEVKDQNTTFLYLDLKSTDIIEGNYSDDFFVSTERKIKRLKINLHVVNDTSQFYIRPDSFKFSLLKSENKSESGIVVVDNPNQLYIQVSSYPNFLKSCVFENNQVKFETKNAYELGVGLFTGSINLKTDKVEKNIFIKIDVVEHLISDFDNHYSYYFALDRHKITVNRVNSSAVKVEMKLEMFFIGYGHTYNEIQIYQLPYFQNKVIFYPGEEVNDFFVKQRQKQSFENSFDAYQFAIVKITLSEIDEYDNLLKNYHLNEIRFVPGYKPKCFPFFTDFSVRRFFPSSNISISAAMMPIHDDVNNLATRIGQKLNYGHVVRSINFNATNFNSENEIEDFKSIQFIPVPASSKIINIYFETHNLIFDWFSCAGDYELSSDFEHTISDNVKSGSEEKFDTKQTKNIIINTGWILKEEVEVIDAIFNSNFVLIELSDKIIRAIPSAKKNSLASSQQGFKSAMLEFKILQDER